MAEEELFTHSFETSSPAPDSSAEKPFLFGIARKWWVIVAVGMSSLMTALDGSVVNAVLPVITKSLQSELALTSWVAMSYLLVLSGLLLTFGRLGDLYGHKRVFTTGFSIFILGSVLCGMAPTVWVLIASRALQAIGAAILSANSPAILTKAFPASQRGLALGMQATLTYIGLTMGPSVGGILAAYFGWRSIFYINVPIGLLAMLVGVLTIPGDGTTRTSEQFDLLGAGVFIVGMVGLLFGLNRGSEWGWGSPRLWGVIAGSILLLALFVYIERRVPSPMLDLTLFRSPLFSVATISAVVIYICLHGNSLLMPFYLIDGRGLPTDRAGLILSIQPLVMAVVSPLTGYLSDRVGSRWMTVAGMGILALVFWQLSGLGPASPFWVLMINLAVLGIGMALFASPNNNALLGAAPSHRRGVASGVVATARNVGMVLGIGVSSAVFTTAQMEAAARGEPAPFFSALRITYLVLVAVAVAGTLITYFRGDDSPKKGGARGDL